MKATIPVDGRSVEVEFRNCILCTSGEYGGNIDFNVVFSESVPDETVLENLRLRIPGKETLLDICATGELDGVHEITIFSGSELGPVGKAIPESAVPATVDLFWLAADENNPLLTMPVTAEAGPPDDIQPGDYPPPATQSTGGGGCGTTVLAILGVILACAFAVEF